MVWVETREVPKDLHAVFTGIGQHIRDTILSDLQVSFQGPHIFLYINLTN